ncbi:catechol 1,2-dioxygenase [Nitriliruptoraceae bacterium ZYF776]|nr:catechol 1,2-dioxygenase [Profundirhabdus halotolerans]
MSELVVGVAASHSTLMNTHWDATEDRDGATQFRDALSAARDAVVAAEPDVAIVVGSNHFRGLWLDLMPSFTLGIGEVNASGESGTPEGPLPTDEVFARSVCEQVVRDGFDLAFSNRLQVDHGISHAVQYVLADLELPVVPLVVNMFAPPLPPLARCVALGRAIAAAVAGDGLDRRVAVVASGGLSHALPWPDWRDPRSDDDAFMVEAWLNGRTDWASYDARRREIILKADAWLNEEFDRDVLRRFESGHMEPLVDLEDRLTEVAGNGAAELRSWLLMAAACGFRPGRPLGYSPMYEWRTGMAAGVIEFEGNDK